MLTYLTEALSTEIRTPMGLPTLQEVRREEKSPGAEARQGPVEKELGSETEGGAKPIETQADIRSKDQQAELGQISTAKKEGRITGNEARRERRPHKATTRSSASTSAGLRPQVDLTGKTDPRLVKDQEMVVKDQVGRETAKAQVIAQADRGEALAPSLRSPLAGRVALAGVKPPGVSDAEPVPTGQKWDRPG